MPRYSSRTLLAIQWGLLKYRNWEPDANTSSLKLFQYNNLLHKDSVDGDLDPFPRRAMPPVNR